MIVQGKCRSVHSNNCKGHSDLDILVSRKEIFLESSHHIETNIDVVVEIIEVHSSVSFIKSSYNFGELV